MSADRLDAMIAEMGARSGETFDESIERLFGPGARTTVTADGTICVTLPGYVRTISCAVTVRGWPAEPAAVRDVVDSPTKAVQASLVAVAKKSRN